MTIAVTRACTTATIAKINDTNIDIVHKLYPPPVTNPGHPPRTPPSQPFCLPGDICQTIRHITQNKATGLNADSTDSFIDLVFANTPQVNDDLQYIFNQIYINNIPQPIKHFFSDVYLFCLHKDPTDASKLRPLGIPTAMRRIIAWHVAQYFKPKFAEYLLPYNFAVGIPQGSATIINAIQFAIEKYISNNEQQGLPPTRAAVFFDLSNMFNNISCVEFLDIIAASFPELIPLIQLFYDSPGTVHYKFNIVKWTTLFMEEESTQGWPYRQYWLP